MRAEIPDFHPFALEEWQSRHEQEVAYNLADSGVRPVRLRELVGHGLELDRLLELDLHYPMVNGTSRLRERIAALHPGAEPDQVLVTVGAAEANAIAVETLLRPGEVAVAMTPSYAQIEGLARNRGCHVEPFPLDPVRGWRPDLDRLETALKRGARLVAVCHPNNPTAQLLSKEEIDAIVGLAERAGAWLVADEVYGGSELDGVPAASFWGRSDRVLVVGSLSKAYGLSGLRLGWIVAPPGLVQPLWRRHEYLTIAAAALSMAVAEQALEPAIREWLLERNRSVARRGWQVLSEWLARRPELSAVPPRATGFAFIQVRTGECSPALEQRLRTAGVLVAPGICFGIPDHFRLCHAMDPEHLPQALELVARVLEE
jgi:aspartate/methionine/tyrosine aminotransferase